MSGFSLWWLLVNSQVRGEEEEGFLRGEAIMKVAVMGDINRRRKVRLTWAKGEDPTKGNGWERGGSTHEEDGAEVVYMEISYSRRTCSYVVSDLGTVLADMK